MYEGEKKEKKRERSWPLPTPSERPESIYDLYSVVNHFGSMGAGHYVSFSQNKHDKQV